MDIAEAQCLTEEHLVKSLELCDPLSDHLYPDAIGKLANALNDNEGYMVREIIDEGAKPHSNPLCITALKAVASYLCTTEGVKMIRDATWNLISNS